MSDPDEQVPERPEPRREQPDSTSRFGGRELWTAAGGPAAGSNRRSPDGPPHSSRDRRTHASDRPRPRASQADGAASDGGNTTGAAGASDGGPTAGAADRGASAGASPRGRGSFLRELPVLLIVALVLAFLLRTFVVQVFYIPSSSMEPTLQRDDRMVVEKLTYLFREPRHGEILVFEGDSDPNAYPDDTMASRTVRLIGQFLGLVPVSARDFVKRVIALPGDEVEVRGGEVFVNGTPLDEPYVLNEDESDFGPLVVPDGELFFLGDNRPNSSDSRSTLGTVPRDHVVGRSVLIIWPFDHAGGLTGVEHDVSAPDPSGDADPSGAAGDPDVEVAVARAHGP